MRSADFPSQASGYTLFSTALGRCGVAWGSAGLLGVQLPEADEARLVAGLARRAPGAPQVTRGLPGPVRTAVQRIQRHLDGRPDPMLDLEVDLGGLPPFAAAAYRELRRVAPGQTVTYGELAGRCGSPGGSRAAGAAMAANPLPLVVPCHRVLAAGGGLGGFSAHGGASTKLRLLAMEGADLAGVARAGAAQLRRTDERLGAVIRRVGAYRLPGQQDEDPFSLLCRSIVHQQVSMKAGATIFRRLRDLVGEGKGISARRVLQTDPEQLRGAGLSRQKSSYIRDLAEKTADGTLPLRRLARMDDAAVIEALVKVKGIGVWSAQMFLMFHLGRLDVLPVDDLGLRKGVQRLLGLEHLPGRAELEQVAGPWAPFRSVATWYLWRSLEAGGV